MSSGIELCWPLPYTKPRAEEWVEINLRTQGLATLVPRVCGRSGFGPLFPNYLFGGFEAGQSPRPMRSSLGCCTWCGEVGGSEGGRCGDRAGESVVREAGEGADEGVGADA